MTLLSLGSVGDMVQKQCFRHVTQKLSVRNLFLAVAVSDRLVGQASNVETASEDPLVALEQHGPAEEDSRLGSGLEANSTREIYGAAKGRG